MRISNVVLAALIVIAAAVLLAVYSRPSGKQPAAPAPANPVPHPAAQPLPAVVQPAAPDQPGEAPSVTPAVTETLEAQPQPAAPIEKEDAMKYRWVFSFGYGRDRENVDKIKSLVDTAAAHGLNGLVLSSFGLDAITRWPEQDFGLLKEIDAHCKEKKIELVPTGFSVGYGGGALGHDPNFAAALPAVINLEAKDGRIAPAPPGENLIKNGDLEQHSDGRFSDFDFHDQPGQVSFADTEVVCSGKTSMRFENFTANQHGHGRIMQKVPVKPGCMYRFTYKMKTENLQPVSGVQALVLKEEGTVASLRPNIRATQDWTEISLDFMNSAEKELRVYAGIWGGKSGKFWLDDLRLHEYGTLDDIVRREGTPLELRSRDREMTFVEGRDFEQVKNQRNLKSVAVTVNTAIKDGERLVLSCYKTPFIAHSWGRQISLCMSNPALYEYWEAQARKMYEVLKYKKVLLSMDEIRNGGGCLLCRNRDMSMAQILGDCISRQFAIFKEIDPEIEVFIWSDMLDPKHNARNNYYNVVGDFTGSWNYIPKELIIACWYHQIRNDSLKFFSEQGFRTLGAAYYDADDLQNCKEWLESLKNTPNAVGIMYTSWERKYGLLADFGDLVSKE